LEVPKIQRGNRGLGDKEGTVVGWKRPVVLTSIECLLFVSSGYALKKIPSAGNLPSRESFQSFPIHIGQWEGQRSYIPQEILDQLWADDYVQVSYVNPHTRNAIHLLIPFYEWQGTRHTIHTLQSCLLGGGWALTGSEEKMVAVEPGRKIPVMTLKLAKGSAKILGSYFFFQRGRAVTNPWLNKAYLMWDAITERRTDGALVRAELVMAPGQSIDDAWEKLKGFITDLWPILPKYVPE
jgi:EpsI family protein